MAPKKLDPPRLAKQVFTPTRANPEISEGTEEDEGSKEEVNPSLNQAGLNSTFDKIVSPPRTGKRKELAADSASLSFPGTSTTKKNWNIEQQADQKKQHRHFQSH